MIRERITEKNQIQNSIAMEGDARDKSQRRENEGKRGCDPQKSRKRRGETSLR